MIITTTPHFSVFYVCCTAVPRLYEPNTASLHPQPNQNPLCLTSVDLLASPSVMLSVPSITLKGHSSEDNITNFDIKPEPVLVFLHPVTTKHTLYSNHHFLKHTQENTPMLLVDQSALEHVDRMGAVIYPLSPDLHITNINVKLIQLCTESTATPASDDTAGVCLYADPTGSTRSDGLLNGTPPVHKKTDHTCECKNSVEPHYTTVNEST